MNFPGPGGGGGGGSGCVCVCGRQQWTHIVFVSRGVCDFMHYVNLPMCVCVCFKGLCLTEKREVEGH